MRVLLVDNYDSFTYNLFHLIADVTGVEPRVVVNDSAEWHQLDGDQFDAVVISPGPGHPASGRDIGHSVDVFDWPDVAVLGVCLGHQLIAQHFGGKVARAACGPRHGRLSSVHHCGTDLLGGLPNPFDVVRYHSLAVDTLPPDLVATAWADDGTLMALRHLHRPLWGVQFHPESILSQHGHRLLENFMALASRPHEQRRAVDRESSEPPAFIDLTSSRPPRIVHRRLDEWRDPAATYRALFEDSSPAFWLDSSRPSASDGRMSFMGDLSGKDAHWLTYDSATRTVTRTSKDEIAELDISIFDYLKVELSRQETTTHDLPFEFQLGYVGYFGYELQNECGGHSTHAAPTPDAFLAFADRVIAFDHIDRAIYLVTREGPDADEWFEVTQQRLDGVDQHCDVIAESTGALAWSLRHDEAKYKQMIEVCRDEIEAGETYEVCLTNMISTAPLDDYLQTYLTLRTINPAPFSAYLRMPTGAVLSSSPERFLQIAPDGHVQTKPIKGTAERSSDPSADDEHACALRHSDKERAENLMIVDLLRNDLGRVCAVGSVGVPAMFEVETYATVHQLVSTVEGQLRADRSAIDCLQAGFPGGSVTGAPKGRTLEIIDRLEGGYRGVYTGSIGWLSLTGAADLNVAIRTIVATEDETTMGIGGAITALSDVDSEFEETLLKGRALLRAVASARSRAAVVHSSGVH